MVVFTITILLSILMLLELAIEYAQHGTETYASLRGTSPGHSLSGAEDRRCGKG